MASSARFLVLGPIAVVCDGRALPVRGYRSQALVVALVISANHVVPADRLIDAMWPNEWPASPRHALQSQVSVLRRRVAAAIDQVGGGYVLRAECEEIDACTFTRLVRTAERLAKPDPSGALSAAREALASWRGQAFGDLCSTELCQLEAIRLEELRVDAQEIALTSMIEIGLVDEAVAELRAAVVDHPYRERLWLALLHGLVAARRRGDALSAFDEYRRAMRVLGLAADPELTAVVEGLVHHAPEQAR